MSEGLTREQLRIRPQLMRETIREYEAQLAELDGTRLASRR
ncbi:MAG TPA: hypothetical protein VFI46_02215 [Jiangellaceae bacterium]|nr:hypothetical protein [Jiangellaceae bacterium]